MAVNEEKAKLKEAIAKLESQLSVLVCQSGQDNGRMDVGKAIKTTQMVIDGLKKKLKNM